MYFTDAGLTDIYQGLSEGQSEPFYDIFYWLHLYKKTYMSVMHTSLMARLKEHVNVLTAI